MKLLIKQLNKIKTASTLTKLLVQIRFSQHFAIRVTNISFYSMKNTLITL